jgi:hypothetical protein
VPEALKDFTEPTITCLVEHGMETIKIIGAVQMENPTIAFF